MPSVLCGAIVLLRGGEGLDYASAWAIGLLAAAIQGALGRVDRLRARRRRARARDDRSR